MLALIQGINTVDSKCITTNVTVNGTFTDTKKTVVLENMDEPQFGIPIFFVLLAVMCLISILSFTGLNILKIAKNEKIKQKKREEKKRDRNDRNE